MAPGHRLAQPFLLLPGPWTVPALLPSALQMQGPFRWPRPSSQLASPRVSLHPRDSQPDLVADHPRLPRAGCHLTRLLPETKCPLGLPKPLRICEDLIILFIIFSYCLPFVDYVLYTSTLPAQLTQKGSKKVLPSSFRSGNGGF